MDEEEVVAQTGLAADQVRGSLQRLRSKHLTVLEEEHLTRYRLTPRGTSALADGLPERRFLEAMDRRGGSMSFEQAAAEGLSDEERSAAVGILRRRGMLADGFPFRRKQGSAAPAGLLPEEVVLKQIANEEEDLDEAILSALERRGLARTDHVSIKHWAASEEGRKLPLAAEGEDQIGSLTPAELVSGAWKGRGFRPYDVRAAVPFIRGVRENPVPCVARRVRGAPRRARIRGERGADPRNRILEQ